MFSDDFESISKHLVQLSKSNGSRDNISVIIVFLREPSKIAAEAHWANRFSSTMDASLDNANATNNPFTNSNCSDILSQNDGYLLNFKHNGTENAEEFFNDRSTNGKRSADEFDDDEDLGPETDVDAVDDVLLSPSIAAAKAISEGVICDNPTPTFDFEKKEEKIDLEDDVTVEKKETSEFEEPPTKVSREETPTPPADEGKRYVDKIIFNVKIVFFILKKKRVWCFQKVQIFNAILLNIFQFNATPTFSSH